jgi:hypothetical protein
MTEPHDSSPSIVSNTVLQKINLCLHFFIDMKSALGNNPALFFW